MNGEQSNSNVNNRSKTLKDIEINKSYIVSFIGILRIGIILTQFGGCISAASIPKLERLSGEFFLTGEIEHIRSAYLFFSIVGIFKAGCIFLIFALDLFDYLNFLNKLPWRIIILVTDIIWLLATLILSILCAVQEANYNEYSSFFIYYINEGAFGSASFFGFCATCFYSVDAFFFQRQFEHIRVTESR